MTRGSFAVLLSALLTGCVATRRRARADVVAVGAPRPPAGAVDLLRRRAGGFGGTSAALRQCLGPSSAVRVEEFDWSHGRGRMLADHLDHCHILEQGRRMASRCRPRRRPSPTSPSTSSPTVPAAPSRWPRPSPSRPASSIASSCSPRRSRRTTTFAPPCRTRPSTSSSAGRTGGSSAWACACPAPPTGAGPRPRAGSASTPPAPPRATCALRPAAPAPLGAVAGGHRERRRPLRELRGRLPAGVRLAADAAAQVDHPPAGRDSGRRDPARQAGSNPCAAPTNTARGTPGRSRGVRREAAAVGRADSPRLQAVRPAADVAPVALPRGRAGRAAVVRGRPPCRTSRRTTPRRCRPRRTARSRWAGTCRPAWSAIAARRRRAAEVRPSLRVTAPAVEERAR